MSPTLNANCPIFLLSASLPCWQCGRDQLVTGLGVHSGVTLEDGESYEFGDPADTSDLIMLIYIEALPQAVFKAVVQVNPLFAPRSSRTAGTRYYSNGCECGALIGDHYIVGQDGEAFFPTTADEAARVRYSLLPFEGLLPFVASWSHGSGRLILEHGQRAISSSER